ncbi:hypothetical protein USB125703_00111 [Pseudoclavibacter triregionum]|nr:hypothetical protein USB125703_00111 [Pseudoclavibacter triregionum]
MSHVPQPSEPEIRAERESLGDMVASLSANLSELFRKEVALAKAELTESAKQAGKGAGLFGGAGVAGHMALLFLSLTAMFALGTFMDLVWAALVVTLIWAAAAGILAFVGKSEIDKVQGAPQTAETLAEIPDTLKPTPEARR